jgi:hypothetical protein
MMTTDRSRRRKSCGYRAAALAALAFVSTARPAAGQQDVRDVLAFLLTNQSIATGDVERDRDATAATSDTVARALLVALATAPIGSSSSAFTYRLNSELGTVERTSNDFGPVFIERATSSGRGRVSVSFVVQQRTFTTLDGQNLRTGDFVTVATRFLDEPAPFDVETLALRLRTTTAVLSVAAGVSERVDVGVAVPIVSLDMTGERTNTYRGRSAIQAAASARASGLGDVALRSKAVVVGRPAATLALLGEVRLPTGRADDLLGAGRAAARLGLAASLQQSSVALHANAAYGVGGVSRDAIYGAGISVASQARLTITSEIFARRLAAAGRVETVAAPHPSVAGAETIRLLAEGGTGAVTRATTGVKWNPAGTLVVGGYVLWTVGDRGLGARPSPTIAVDYSLGR